MLPPLSASLPALARRLPGALASVHRWLGIAGCLLFVMWFGSGLVMSVVGFPALSDAERLQGLGVLDAAQIRVSPTAALQAAGVLASRGACGWKRCRARTAAASRCGA